MGSDICKQTDNAVAQVRFDSWKGNRCLSIMTTYFSIFSVHVILQVMLTQNMKFGLLENAYVPFSCACHIATLSAIAGVFSFAFKKLIFTTSSRPRQVQDSAASARNPSESSASSILLSAATHSLTNRLCLLEPLEPILLLQLLDSELRTIHRRVQANLELLVAHFAIRQRFHRPDDFDLHSVPRSASQAGSVALGVESVERPNPLLPLIFASPLLYRLHRLAVAAVAVAAVLELEERCCLRRRYPSQNCDLSAVRT